MKNLSAMSNRTKALLAVVGILVLLVVVAFVVVQTNEDLRANLEFMIANNLSGAAVGCDNSAFVLDVTVADNTPWVPGQAFNKIWRMRNTGTCAWGPGYQWVFVSGTPMTAINAIPVPVAGPGATGDLWVPMVAPNTPGTYRGYWQMRSPGGALFGTRVWVQIVVIGPQPQPQPSGCSGNPTISSFTASKTYINPGEYVTLSWGLVGNAEYARIDPEIAGVATPGSRNVAPGSTTTYTLTARCGQNIAQQRVTITVASQPQCNVVNGGWNSGVGFGMNLSGCGSCPCQVQGRFSDSRSGGSPRTGQVSGTFDGTTLAIQVGFTDLIGAPPLFFSGTLSGGNSITGTWRRGTESGSVTFMR